MAESANTGAQFNAPPQPSKSNQAVSENVSAHLGFEADYQAESVIK